MYTYLFFIIWATERRGPNIKVNCLYELCAKT